MSGSARPRFQQPVPQRRPLRLGRRHVRRPLGGDHQPDGGADVGQPAGLGAADIPPLRRLRVVREHQRHGRVLGADAGAPGVPHDPAIAAILDDRVVAGGLQTLEQQLLLGVLSRVSVLVEA